MPDRLEDAFARFEASATPLFRPAPVSALTRRRGRRVWTGLVAGVLVLAVGGPIGALATGAPAPGPAVPQRDIGQIQLPGWELRAPAQFGYGPGTLWAYADGGCVGELCAGSALAASTDNGLTWQPRPGGEGYEHAELIVSPRGNLFLRERDSDTIAQVLPETGASILTDARPGPPELLLANGGDLILECPGEETYGGPDALTCDRPEVADLTSIHRPVVPDGMGRLTQLARDGRGRTWLLGQDPDSRRYRVTSSADGGRTWDRPVERESPDEDDAPATDDPERIRLTVSPTDGDAWVVAGGPVRAWKLGHDGGTLTVEDGDGRRVARVEGEVAPVDQGTQFDAAKASMVRALGENVLAVATPRDGVWICAPGEGRAPIVEDFVATGMDVASDGALVLRDATGRFAVGAGQGGERHWAWPEP